MILFNLRYLGDNTVIYVDVLCSVLGIFLWASMNLAKFSVCQQFCFVLCTWAGRHYCDAFTCIRYNTDPAKAQAISRQLPTVTAQVWSCGICGRRSCSGVGFLQILWFPLSIIPPVAPHSSSTIIWMYQVDLISPCPEKLKN